LTVYKYSVIIVLCPGDGIGRHAILVFSLCLV